MLITATTELTDIIANQSYAVTVSGYNGHVTELEYEDENGWHEHDGTSRDADNELIFTAMSGATRITVTDGSGPLAINVFQLRERAAVADSTSASDIGSPANVISTASFNSRDAATLAAAATFQGVSEDVSRYGRVGVSVTSDNATDGTLWIEVSHDNVNWSGPPRTVADTSTSQPVMWNIVEKWFRIRYVNGTTEATNLSIQTQYSANADILLAHPLNETLIDEMGASLTRAVLVGKDTAGDYINATANTDGDLSVAVHDQSTRSLDFFFGRLDNLTTLSADASPEDTTLTLTSTTGFTAGKTVGVFSLNDVDGFYLGGQIGAPAGSVITVDTPVDIPLASGSAIAATTTNMAVDGSSTTQIFQIGPVAVGSTSVVDITRILGHLLDGTEMDDSKFGGITALTNGVVLRKNDGVITNLWNVKTNADLALICYDFKYSDKAKQGKYGANFRNTYAGQGAHGVVLELLPGEYLEVLIQDDLTGLDEFTMMAQGHFKT